MLHDSMLWFYPNTHSTAETPTIRLEHIPAKAGTLFAQTLGYHRREVCEALRIEPFEHQDQLTAPRALREHPNPAGRIPHAPTKSRWNLVRFCISSKSRSVQRFEALQMLNAASAPAQHSQCSTAELAGPLLAAGA